MPKTNITKKQGAYSIDIEVLTKFDKYCEENFINKSKLASKILKDFLVSKNIM